MRIKACSRGYTIMEVLIFVAVSGLMFTVAATAVHGKQANAEFKQGMNDINTKIREIINDVDNGTFPQVTGRRCTADAMGSAGPVFSAGASGQGTNRQCIFLGKAIQFAPPAPAAGDEGYAVYSVAGRQYVTSETVAREVTNFDQAKPRVIDFSNVTEFKKLQWGLRVTKVVNGATGAQLSGLAFYKSFGAYDDGGALQSGSQNVMLVPITGTLNDSDFVGDVESQSIDANVVSNADITICFQNGSNKFGTVSIGGINGQRLTTKMQIREAASGVCA